MKSAIKRCLFVGFSLTLAALTARRFKQETKLEGNSRKPGSEPRLKPRLQPDPNPAPAPQFTPQPEPLKSIAREPHPANTERTSGFSPDGFNPDGAGRPISPVLPGTHPRPFSATTVTFNGTVVRNGSRFALRETAGELYPLDSAGRAWCYEGEDVRVTGKIDLSTRLLHVDAIEPAAL